MKIDRKKVIKMIDEEIYLYIKEARSPKGMGAESEDYSGKKSFTDFIGYKNPDTQEFEHFNAIMKRITNCEEIIKYITTELENDKKNGENKFKNISNNYLNPFYDKLRSKANNTTALTSLITNA
jgi:hypothetical protein